MKYAFVVLSVLALSLLFAGCTGPGSPQQGGGGNPGANDKTIPRIPADDNGGTAVAPEQNPNPAPAPAPADLSSRCTLSFDNDTVVQGGSVGVSVSAYTQAGESASYLCGEQEKILGSNGLLKAFSLCKYPAAGNYEVWVKINGQPCASKTVAVVAQAAPAPASGSCSILGSKPTAYSNDHRLYEISVKYDGYEPGDKLTWNCGPLTKFMSLGGNTFGNPSVAGGSLTVTCEYVGSLAIENIPPKISVKINDGLCGEVST